jgi:hypothetical protein
MSLRHLFLNVFLILVIKGGTQDTGPFSLEMNFGMQANFFVRSYEENSPAYYKAFLNKNALGTMGGADLKCGISKKSALGIGYARTVNTKEINSYDNFNGISIGIIDLNIRHVNNMFFLYYDHSINRKNILWNLEGGVCYVRSQLQEISFPIQRNGVLFEERNVKNSGMEEAGVFAGFKASWKIDNKFRLGIRSRIFYLASVSTLECISITPTLSYEFN